MDDIILESFPRNDIDALAMLYVKNQDLTDITVEELVEMYDRAHATICAIREQQQRATETWF